MNSPFKSHQVLDSYNSTGHLFLVVDILQEEEEDSEGFAGNLGMSDTGEPTLSDEPMSIHCLSPRRFVARCSSNGVNSSASSSLTTEILRPGERVYD
ncbi:unnamed protein product [Citrullus colocynthis]|uniref:Uncharacterized protein n=1 Tax=Citrullus colocynthis TaxID=252529 RepID=A0ABP0Y4Z0_9ROSI